MSSLEVSQFKAICTISWKFDEAGRSEAECLQYAKERLLQILNPHPQGEEFDEFSIQVGLTTLKNSIKLVHIGECSPEDVFPYITTDDVKKEYVINGQSYYVRMNSTRYFVFRTNPVCVACGLRGTRIMLDINPGDQSPHFNLYGEVDGRLILMTKDHIVPKSKGGEDVLENFQTTCQICNNLKSNDYLDIEELKELRRTYDDAVNSFVGKKETNTIVENKRRELLALKILSDDDK
jgi:hypothetical protein